MDWLFAKASFAAFSIEETDGLNAEELGKPAAQNLVVADAVAKNVAAKGIAAVVLHLLVGLEGVLRSQNVGARAEPSPPPRQLRSTR